MDMFSNLLQKFKMINFDSKKKERNFFEICGYSHYESVVSNVLAFFLDAKAQHNMNDLVVKSLIDCGITELIDDLQFNVEREVRTNNGKYIDILLHNDSHCLVIENKIYSPLNNDLDDYYNFAKNNKKVSPIGILLTVNKTNPNHSNYLNITYSRFINKIKENIGNFIVESYNKYLFLLLELINNLEYLSARGAVMNTDFVKFIKDNEEEIKRLGKELKLFHDDLRRLVKEVNSIVDKLVVDSDVRQWPYRELPELYDTAVSDFSVKIGIDMAIDSIVDPNGWEFQIFIRRDNSVQLNLSEYCNSKGLDGETRDGRFILSKHFPLDTKPIDVAQQIAQLINTLRA